MNADSAGRNITGTIRVQLIALGLCLLILTITLQLWHADLRIPFEYSSDSLFTQLWIKGIIENGWYLHNDRVGIPGGSDLQDFPLADNLHFLLLKALACFASDAADFTKARWAVSILVCLLVSSAGIYYALFGCFLFGIAGL